MINTKCPYCGSSDMTADVDIHVTGDLQPDGTIKVRRYWMPDDELEIAVASSSASDIQGYCGACGAYCCFDWSRGYLKDDEV